MSKKLIIWDFDGVISDTEKLWVENRRRMLNEKFGLNWDFATANRYLGGRSDKTKKEELDRLGIVTDDAFWKEALDRDYELLEEGIELTEGIENIFSNTGLRQCIATGGIKKKNAGQDKVGRHRQLFRRRQNIYRRYGRTRQTGTGSVSAGRRPHGI